MSAPSPPDRQLAEPEVQGLPYSLVSSLLGLAGLLLLLGCVCGLYAAWEQLNEWLKAILLLLLPLVLLALHVHRCRARGEAVFSLAFAAYMAGNFLLLPGSVFLAVYAGHVFGALGALLYALSLLWYGAAYQVMVAISAACALAFAAALSLPILLGMGMVISSVFFCVLGACLLGAALYLHRKRSARLAQLRIARRRQELARASESEPPRA